jgi:hypothetical protein
VIHNQKRGFPTSSEYEGTVVVSSERVGGIALSGILNSIRFTVVSHKIASCHKVSNAVSETAVADDTENSKT